jgi:cyclohexa-1,5-dienecarbonyl-CoA hydratase
MLLPATSNFMATSSAPAYTRLSLDLRPPVARVSLRNPPLNVIDIAMIDELSHVLAKIEGTSDILAIVLNGLGKAFSVGVDVGAHTPDRVHGMLEKFHGVIRALVNSKKVTIAAVHGHCLGGAAEMALVCDMVYTEDSASWGFPEIRLACYPPVAATALAALVGQKRAADLILTGRTISGSEAASIGLANRAVPKEQLDTAVQESLAHLTKLSAAALSVTKKAMYAWDSMHFDKGLARAEKTYFEELMKMEDAQEGINAFLQKRDPRWNNR